MIKYQTGIGGEGVNKQNAGMDIGEGGMGKCKILRK